MRYQQFAIDSQTVLNIYNEKSGILDGDAETEVDLASQAYQIWKNAIDRDSTLQKTISELPDVVYSTRKHTSNLEGPPGVSAARRRTIAARPGSSLSALVDLA